jgi:hypothetical protein
MDVFRVHRVFCDVIRAFDWAKCPKAYGEENACGFDAICGETLEELCGEVQACGWGGCAPGHSVVDGLVPLTVIQMFVDVRGEGNASLCFECLACCFGIAMKV